MGFCSFRLRLVPLRPQGTDAAAQGAPPPKRCRSWLLGRPLPRCRAPKGSSCWRPVGWLCRGPEGSRRRRPCGPGRSFVLRRGRRFRLVGSRLAAASEEVAVSPPADRGRGRVRPVVRFAGPPRRAGLPAQRVGRGVSSAPRGVGSVLPASCLPREGRVLACRMTIPFPTWAPLPQAEAWGRAGLPSGSRGAEAPRVPFGALWWARSRSSLPAAERVQRPSRPSSPAEASEWDAPRPVPLGRGPLFGELVRVAVGVRRGRSLVGRRAPLLRRASSSGFGACRLPCAEARGVRQMRSPA
jgi:hypothetical protein